MQQPGQFALGSGLAGSAGIRSLGAAGQYGQDVTNKQRVDAAGKPMFDPVTNQPLFDASNITQSFMSPYQQNVTDVAKASAVREAQMAQNAQNLGAARQGTYGGARQTLANMERERNLLSNLSNIQTQGSQSAYDRAMQTQQFGAGLGMQGYGQALGAGSALGQIGATQQGTDIARQNQMATMGAQQQALEQNRINQSIQDYSTQQQYPLMQLGFMSNMLRGLPMEGLSRQTYAPQPSYLTQGIGTVGALGSLANVFKGREGGLPKEFESTTGIKSYNVGGSVGGSVESKLQDMSPAELQSYIKETSSPMARQIAEKVLRDKVGRAGGGIIAFSEGKKVKEDPEKERGIGFPEGSETDKRILEFLKNAPSAVVDKFKELNQPRATSFAGTQAELDDLVQRGRMPRRAAAPETSPLNAEAKQSEAEYLAAVADKPNAVVKGIVPAAPAPAEPKAGTKSAEARAETKAESKAVPATTGPGTGIKAVPSDKIMPTAGIKLPSSLDAPFGLEAPVNPDANKTIAQIAAEKEAYMGPNIAAQQEKARLMAEKSNAVDEAKRTTSMRMAEFFAAWGSTPGSTITAGLYALKNKIPDFISDQKEETKIRRAIDKDIAELEKIDRLEKSGNYDQAAKRKAELSKESLDTWGKKVTAASNKYVADVGLQAAGVRAAASGSGGEGKAGTLYNQAVIRFQTEEKNIATAKEKDGEYRRALIKLRADPKNAEALAIKNAKEAGWNAKLKERQDDVEYYKNKQGREARVSGESGETKTAGAPGTAGNPIVLK